MDLNLLSCTQFSIALRMLDTFSRGVNISKKKKKKEREKNSKSHFSKILKNHSPPDKGLFFFRTDFVDGSIDSKACTEWWTSIGRSTSVKQAWQWPLVPCHRALLRIKVTRIQGPIEKRIRWRGPPSLTLRSLVPLLNYKRVSTYRRSIYARNRWPRFRHPLRIIE